ncbi:MAG TPA: UTP--glucose-1-phosphate uridylyltransferase [Candidatus Limnocylindria bacterium]|nr:UTP--glucose-1-phosphate uridylyltransferase [Candidatus Limnocylindria bacterium]
MDESLAAAFAPFAAKMEAAGLPRLAIDCFRHYFEHYRRGETGLMPESSIAPVTDVPDVAALAGYRAAGRQALGRAVVIKLNGGLGTTMGLSAAKSLLPAKGGLSFLDLIVRQVLHLRREHGCALPLVLMNSFRTRDDSRRVLERYPELATGLPEDFLQHKVPRIGKDDGRPATWPANPELEWCPPGHGDVYPALLTSGLLDALRARGIRWAFLSNADNLGACLDLDVLGWVASEEIPFLMEVADRSEADKKGGHVARASDGRLVLRETAQCPPDDVTAFQDVRRHRYFNTNNLWVDLDVLARLLEERRGILGLSMIVNEKPIDPHDPSSPRVIQLETAMGAAIGVFPGARVLHVPRGRLVPVKTTSDLLALWSDAYELADDFRVVVSPRRRAGDLVVDLDPAYYREVDDLTARFPDGPPSLVGCHRFVVRGDVRFGGGVVAEGDVTIRQEGSAPREVPAGSVLRG